MANTYGQKRPDMCERITIQHNDPPVLSVVSLTRSSTTATCTTAVPHNYLATDYVTVTGANESAWNAKVKIVTVPTPTTFTFTCGGTLVTPATGAAITVKYTSNSAGGQGANGYVWRELATVRAEMVPLTSNERLQLAAIQSNTSYRFRVRIRPDLAPTQQILWTPSWPPGVAQRKLQITGVIEDDAELTYMCLDAAVAA